MVMGLWGVLVVLVGAFCRCWSSFWGGCVGCVLLLLLLGSHGHLLGGCRPSWADRVISGVVFVLSCMGVTWWEGGCAVSLGNVVWWWPALLVAG